MNSFKDFLVLFSAVGVICIIVVFPFYFDIKKQNNKQEEKPVIVEQLPSDVITLKTDYWTVYIKTMKINNHSYIIGNFQNGMTMIHDMNCDCFKKP
jgi:hypothetical protein